jgi:hypothetical protein
MDVGTVGGALIGVGRPAKTEWGEGMVVAGGGRAKQRMEASDLAA